MKRSTLEFWDSGHEEGHLGPFWDNGKKSGSVPDFLDGWQL